MKDITTTYDGVELMTTDIDYSEMKSLIASQTMLDMIIAAKNSERDYYFSEVIKAAEKVRSGYTATTAENDGEEGSEDQ